MNIFFTDPNPAQCALNLCDKHVVKMTLETAQILSTVKHRYGVADSLTYRETHRNHPCVLWAGDSAPNYVWLVQHGYALAAEYAYRFEKVHKSLAVIHQAAINRPQIPALGTLSAVKCMPDEFKVSDVYSSYRRYYISKANSIRMVYTGRDVPKWLIEGFTNNTSNTCAN